MHYQQISLARLSRSGKKLINDRAWHQFTHEEKLFYRVRGRIVQKVHLEENENEEYLRLMNAIEPLPSRIFREGFREEIVIKKQNDHFIIGDILIRSFYSWKTIAEFITCKNIFLQKINDTTLECTIHLEELDQKNLFAALLSLKTFTLTIQEMKEDEALQSPREFIRLFETMTEVLKQTSVSRKKRMQSAL